MRIVLGVILVALASCATKPATLQDLRLVGTEPSWSGMLTPKSLRLKRASGPEILVRNPGSPCRGEQQPCFFGNVGGSRYVNAPALNSRYLSLVADREPCRDADSGRLYPYAVSVNLRDNPSGANSEQLAGCAGPPSMFRPERRPR